MSETQTQPVSFACPLPLVVELTQEAKNRGVTLEELIASLVVTPLSDQLAELHLSRFDQ